ncbi:hypothetical protein [Kitasatospora sp. NPDC056181]|uniref:hypothetical protein n=1 Tax=Kitasatospora sp. NPDC056181 TaxID=3345737 RepID=UPI0035D623B3
MTFPISHRLAWRLLAALLAPVVLLALRTGDPTALIGILPGVAVGLVFPDVWTLLFHRATGARLVIVRYGSGRRLASATFAGVPVEIGLVPSAELTLFIEITPVPWLRPRLWLNSAALLAVQLGLGALLATHPNGFARELGISLLVTTVVINLRCHPAPLSPLWTVLGLTLRRHQIEHLLRHPDLVRAERHVIRGQIGEARRLLDLVPASARVNVTQAGILLAEDRYE